MQRVVLDTNVILSGLKSKRGASFKLLTLLGTGKFEIAISVPLIIEYEDVLLRKKKELGLTKKEIQYFLDYICQIGHKQSIFFLWRPKLSDPKDELVLEVTVAAGSETIITFNKKHFKQSEEFGVSVLTPKEFLIEIGELQ